ncbi:MAG: hypothetical protein NUW01_00495 [Gemmatimonadaceae bacterium]|nr:hypothetical protein [Gemmatimonadaceae bacterium]
MSETKFTEGPWIVEREENEPEAGEEWRMRVMSLGEERYLSLIEGAYFVIDPSVRPGENEANANLIAAAPDLYAALNDLFATMEHDLRRRVSPTSGYAALIAEVEAALAKARGEQ